jgi:hypothetical protein
MSMRPVRIGLCLAMRGVAIVATSCGALDDGGEGREATEQVTRPLTSDELTWNKPPDEARALQSGPNKINLFQVRAGDLNLPYQVLIQGTNGVADGRVHVRAQVDDPTSCTFSSLAVRAWARTESAYGWLWNEVDRVDLSGQWITSLGELPIEECALGREIVPAGQYTHIRLVAQAKTFVPLTSPHAINVSVSYEGFKPPPPPKKKLTVTLVWRVDDPAVYLDNNIAALVLNDGPATATEVKARATAEYYYCDKPYCQTDAVTECWGHFCPSGIQNAPSGAGVWPLPHAKPCFDSLYPAANQAIPGGKQGWFYFGPVKSETCGPCIGDGRCAGLSVKVTTTSDAAASWETWDKSSKTLTVPEVVLPL